MLSILTIKIKHDLDFGKVFKTMKAVVRKSLALKKSGLSLFESIGCKQFKDYGLNGGVVQATCKKYVQTKTIKSLKNIKIVIPKDRLTFKNNVLKVNCLDLEIQILDERIVEIKQIEIGSEYFYVSFSVKSSDQIETSTTLGVDFNLKGNVVTVAIPETKWCSKLGRSLKDIHTGYKNKISKLQKAKKFKVANRLSKKRFNDVNTEFHRVSRKVVNLAIQNNSEIVLENLTGIRKGKAKKEVNKSSWGFYKLRQFIEYKAKIAGIPVKLIDPRNTSKACSRCGEINNVSGKKFSCKNCGHCSHRDINAAFNIANKSRREQAGLEMVKSVSNSNLLNEEKAAGSLPQIITN
jgi:putative transposase